MTNHKINIASQKEHETALKKIDALMKKGEENLTKNEISELKGLALAVQAYEKNIYTITVPQTLCGD